ncbi:DUF962 domain-containing protein [Schlegelella sp. S2-27]|uniref:DUF962 domain-containing protein n=1 Tax=Caldimonas mangrovi TaxID=2944811 RepID=A0ABT0YI33_9BURK|nr:Mpo1-like protein [Caldimonas mangrovi]MCM5678383.1 DUF962 domain-containing protein [Caldimonas mangrovi]
MNTSTLAPTDPKACKSFAEFYPFYLAEHSNRTCRRLHFIGSTLALSCLALSIATAQPYWLLVGLLCGYGFAWVGHFGFEKNKPASFKRPLYSFMGDWVMYKDLWTGKIAF